MNWWLHNLIADMPGPTFLIVFVSFVVAIVIVAAVAIRRSDHTRGLEPPPIPKKPNPLEIAYLRGGANEVARLLVFDLVRRGYLEVHGEGAQARIERAENQPAAPLVEPLERNVLGYFSTSRDAQAMFRPGGLASQVEEWCEHIRWSLYEEELLSPSERYRFALGAALIGALLILSLGGYKLSVALAKGRTNVIGLIVLSVLGLLALAIACCVPRLSSRGRAYLANLKSAFEGLRSGIEETRTTKADSTAVLIPAVFGMAALSGTSYAFVADLFRRASATGGGCGGASCGSGGCGGGGGGGCGGGGCGGCGGG
jgi:uncharacterized protein (TIGR04222 family)